MRACVFAHEEYKESTHTHLKGSLLPEFALKGQAMYGLAHERSCMQASTSRSVPARQGRRRLVVQAKQRTFTKKEVVVGIDLGTTNSAVAYMEKGKPVCIPNSEGEPTTPSVVAVQPGGEVLVGKKARKYATLNPETTYYSVKRLIGG